MAEELSLGQSVLFGNVPVTCQMENFPWRVTVNYSRDNSRRSFTLIELLMVISIISLLIALLLPALQRAKRQVRLIICASNQHQIGIELMSYVIDWGQYPPTWSRLHVHRLGKRLTLGTTARIWSTTRGPLAPDECGQPKQQRLQFITPDTTKC